MSDFLPHWVNFEQILPNTANTLKNGYFNIPIIPLEFQILDVLSLKDVLEAIDELLRQRQGPDILLHIELGCLFLQTFISNHVSMGSVNTQRKFKTIPNYIVAYYIDITEILYQFALYIKQYKHDFIAQNEMYFKDKLNVLSRQAHLAHIWQAKREERWNIEIQQQWQEAMAKADSKNNLLLVAQQNTFQPLVKELNFPVPQTPAICATDPVSDEKAGESTEKFEIATEAAAVTTEIFEAENICAELTNTVRNTTNNDMVSLVKSAAIEKPVTVAQTPNFNEIATVHSENAKAYKIQTISDLLVKIGAPTKKFNRAQFFLLALLKPKKVKEKLNV